MKKSEQFTRAMELVIDNEFLTADMKLEIIETLLEERQMALYREKQMEKESGNE